ncbi:MAG TPA: hypothetical protein VI259_02855, partial [Gemmatimonadaceae bacterium]
VVASAKHVDNVDVAWHARHRAIYTLAEDFGHVGIIDRHWDDLESGPLSVRGHVVARLAGIDLDPEDSNATRVRDHAPNAFIIIDDVATPIVVAL